MKTSSEVQRPPSLEDKSADAGTFWAWFRLWFGFGLSVVLAVSGFLWWERDLALNHANNELKVATEEAEKWLQNSDLSSAGQIEQRLKDALADKYVMDTSRATELLTQVHNHHIQLETHQIQLEIQSQLESALEHLDSLDVDGARAILFAAVQKPRGDVSQMRSILKELDDAGSEYNAKVHLFDLSDNAFASLKSNLEVPVKEYSHHAIDRLWASNLTRNLDAIAELRESLAKRKRGYKLEKTGRTDKEEWTIFENKFGTNPVGHIRRGYDMDALQKAAIRQSDSQPRILTDRHGTQFDESKAARTLEKIHRQIEAEPGQLKKAYFQGVEKALNEEFNRLKRDR